MICCASMIKKAILVTLSFEVFVIDKLLLEDMLGVI